MFLAPMQNIPCRSHISKTSSFFAGFAMILVLKLYSQKFQRASISTLLLLVYLLLSHAASMLISIYLTMHSLYLIQASSGKTPSKNQCSSSNIFELESSISKVAFESSAEGSKTPDATTPDSRFTFNITMKYPQGNSGELKLKLILLSI